jgi:hypothetical protein
MDMENELTAEIVAANEEWQKARWRPVHDYSKDPTFAGAEWIEKLKRKIMRVRPLDGNVNPYGFIQNRCDAKKFFEVHPDDRLRPRHNVNEVICEHELLME